MHKNKRSLLISQTSASSNQNDIASAKDSFWRDPAWQSAGVVITIILTFLTILISWKQSQRKSFAYSVISKVNILDIKDDSIRGKVKITFESKTIQDLYLIIIKFANSGNTPILPSDYYRPLSIRFGEGAEILSVEILKQSPSNLGITAKHTSYTSVTSQKTVIDPSTVKPDFLDEQDRVIVEPTLLNKGDSFDLKILVTKFQSVNIDARISGIKKIEEREEATLKVPSWIIPILLILSLLIPGAFILLVGIVLLNKNLLEASIISFLKKFK